MTHRRVVGVDWGSSSFRCYLLREDGFDVLETGDWGITRFTGAEQMAAHLDAVLDRHQLTSATVLLSGMITSRSGWVQTPYLPVPVEADDLVTNVLVMQRGDRELRFLPGVRADDGVDAELMRGEEVELIGLASTAPLHVGTVVLPGTHSKWVRLREGVVLDFQTFVTGELYELMQTHSLAADFVVTGSDDPEAFDDGVRSALADDAAHGGLLRLLFRVRTRGILQPASRGSLRSYLSGLMIGSELRGGLARGRLASGVVVVGADRLAARYRRAFCIAGVRADAPSSRDLAAVGLQRLAWGS
jgi:2-dehydro-3-deoxygalactonokinase